MTAGTQVGGKWEQWREGREAKDAFLLAIGKN